jgi:Cu2+-exporting ATPase
LATPTVITVATHALKRRGFLITRGHALDTLASATDLVFDKTGTLTGGHHRMVEIVPLATVSRTACLQLAASLEALSSHPIATAFSESGSALLSVTGFHNTPGQGVSGCIDGVDYRLGRPGFVGYRQLDPPSPDGRWILLADAEQPLAWFALRDALRDEALESVERLREVGVDIALLSGDNKAAVDAAAKVLGIGQRVADSTPESKLAWVRELQRHGRSVIMVGDGVNDVPVLSGANVSIAVSGASDVTQAHADCLLLAGDLRRIPEAIRMARAARRVIKQNLVWAIGYNLLAIPFAAAGFVPPWLAAIGMSMSSLVVVANALRLRRSTPRFGRSGG